MDGRTVVGVAAALIIVMIVAELAVCCRLRKSRRGGPS
jgi:hypothetical protein